MTGASWYYEECTGCGAAFHTWRDRAHADRCPRCGERKITVREGPYREWRSLTPLPRMQAAPHRRP